MKKCELNSTILAFFTNSIKKEILKKELAEDAWLGYTSFIWENGNKITTINSKWSNTNSNCNFKNVNNNYIIITKNGWDCASKTDKYPTLRRLSLFLFSIEIKDNISFLFQGYRMKMEVRNHLLSL